MLNTAHEIAVTISKSFRSAFIWRDHAITSVITAKLEKRTALHCGMKIDMNICCTPEDIHYKKKPLVSYEWANWCCIVYLYALQENRYKKLKTLISHLHFWWICRIICSQYAKSNRKIIVSKLPSRIYLPKMIFDYKNDTWWENKIEIHIIEWCKPIV